MFAWFAEFCAMLPVAYEIDWVRAYQPVGTASDRVGCDPPSHPTRQWIAAHEPEYMHAPAEAPLLAVTPGGAPCLDASECGGVRRGSCIDGHCTCALAWVGSRCLSQAAGDARHCRPFEDSAAATAAAARASASWLTRLTNGLRACAAPAHYNVTMLRRLASAVCAAPLPPSSSDAASRLVAQACDKIQYVSNGSYAMCSAAARATHAAHTFWLASGCSACCNAITIGSDGAPELRCHRASVPLWLLLLPAALLAGALALNAVRKQRRVGGMSEATKRIAAQAETAPLVTPSSGPTGSSESSSSEEDAELAEAHLALMRPAAQAQRLQLVERLAATLGCQPDSAANQAAHLESLILSKLGRDHVRTEAAAIDALHAALVAPYTRWRQHMSGIEDNAHGQLADGATPVVWKCLTTHEQLIEVTVYLLLWGEAGNLRFMPELIWFLYDCALTHVRLHAADDNVAAAATAAAVPAVSSYLRQVVQPIYSHVFSTSFSGLKNGQPVPRSTTTTPLNYDDWNESCWSCASLQRLRTRSGTCVLQAAPRDRWALVALADWPHFFNGGGKTFYEERWWWCVFAANRRLFLLHAFTFVTVVAIRIPSTFVLNGWGSLALLPVLFLLPSISSVGGLVFESYYAPHSWADGVAVSRLRNASMLLLLFFCAAIGSAVYMSTVAFNDFMPISRDRDANLFVVAAILLLVGGASAFIWELLPQRPPSHAFDANLFFETRSAALLRQPWLRRARSWCGWVVRPEVCDVARMYVFWVLVWGAKTAFAASTLIPAVFSAHLAVSSDVALLADASALDAGSVLRRLFVVGLWGSTALTFLADTLLWYSIVMGLWGGVAGLLIHGITPGGVSSRKVRNLQQNLAQKLLPFVASHAEREERLCKLWNAIVEDLYTTDLISAEERKSLRRSDGRPITAADAPTNREARRRLLFFSHSLEDPSLPDSAGVLACAGLTVLVPHYAESILLKEEEVGLKKSRRLTTFGGALGTPMPFLVQRFADEYAHFVARSSEKADHATHEPAAANFTLNQLAERRSSTDEVRTTTVGERSELASPLATRKWASLRLQTLYRTLAGLMKNRTALRLLLHAQVGSLAQQHVDELISSKFTLLAALQRYHVMRLDELADVEALLAEFPSLTITYIEEEKNATDPAATRFFSCLVDGACTLDGLSNRRVPRYRIELPGHPILGNGKSDNQNHAIIFSRGEIIQAIDANQEGYLEEALKLPNVLREFDKRPPGAVRGPAIVGFREHIFSGLGALGKFAAASEFVFGSLTQRTMAQDLGSRYHYGHPDMMDKLAMMAQGGVSKATRGLNLSEDIFAGMDATLRGHSIVHREYYQVGKGRDMGFLSILGFLCKLSSGTAQMTTSRQAYRLGTRLGLARLFGFYYGHTGYYVGQLHFYRVCLGSIPRSLPCGLQLTQRYADRNACLQTRLSVLHASASSGRAVRAAACSPV